MPFLILAFLWWNRERRRCNAARARRDLNAAWGYCERMWLGTLLIQLGGLIDSFILLPVLCEVFDW